MWFLFGLISFVAASVHFYLKRRDARWSAIEKSVQTLSGGDPAGNMRYLEGIEYSGNKRVSKLRIGLDNVPGYDFRLHLEGARDVFSKWIGISIEHKVGDSGFDDTVYIVSDDEIFKRMLTATPALREHIAQLIKPYRIGHFPLKSIRCRNGRLWAEYRPGSEFQTETVSVIARSHLPHLAAIKEHLNACLEVKPSLWRDPFVIRAILLLSISTGSVTLGATGILRTIYTADRTINVSGLLMQSIQYSGTALLILIAAAIVLLGRSARAHLVILELLLVGGAGFLLSGYTLARDINIEFDTGGYSEQIVTITNKETRRRRKRGSSYHFEISPRETATGVSRLRVYSADYWRYEQGQRIRLIVYPGRLGQPWLGAIQPVPNL